MQNLIVSPNALQCATALLPHITEGELCEMVRKAAICTHAHGNRRYRQHVFNVREGVILSVHPYDTTMHVINNCETCGGYEKIKVYNICGNCDGAGCPICEDGDIEQWIACPTCRNDAIARIFKP